ncbi:FliO/MopB family protein [Gimesia panareensis]|uniref:FliO/MopB family protein n=1 Tax=Gimesia panareensis TaxID=2527978 RepID=UPI0011885019|nr:flagellar biosynthetic protein FliO [Gimesia panareensis]QDU49735.1 hypothetical protein Pan110_20740 [Gimesia panareensis]
MIRLCILVVLILICTLLSAARSWAADPAFPTRTTEFRPPRTMAGSPNSYSRSSQQGQVPAASERQLNNRPVSGHTGITQSQTRSIPQRTAPVEAKPVANPITPLARQKQGDQSRTDQTATRRVPSIWGTFGALALVIGIILIAAKLMKKHNPLAAKNLPREVIEVLGRRPLDARQTIHFVRCGSRILILGSSPAGLETLSEVLDPVEVDLITGMCREQAEAARSNQTFLNLFQSAQQKTETNRFDQNENRVSPSGRSEPESRPEQADFSDYDSAVNRLQQKLLQPSRQSLSDSAERDHV